MHYHHIYIYLPLFIPLHAYNLIYGAFRTKFDSVHIFKHHEKAHQAVIPEQKITVEAQFFSSADVYLVSVLKYPAEIASNWLVVESQFYCLASQTVVGLQRLPRMCSEMSSRNCNTLASTRKSISLLVKPDSVYLVCILKWLAETVISLLVTESPFHCLTSQTVVDLPMFTSYHF